MKLQRALVWSMLIALLFSLVPVLSSGVAHAASTGTFLPDDTKLGSTNLLTLAASDLTRANVLVVTGKKLTVDGTFNAVDKDSMNVKVEQLLGDPTQLDPASAFYKPDSGRTYSKAVSSPASSRFSIANLDLYPGLNRLTFSGSQAGIQRTDSFFVLYDAVPYLSDITVTAGSNPPLSLGSGSAAIVVDRSQVLLSGTSLNTNKIVIKVNNAKTGTQVTVPDDGRFFAPPISLVPGLNTIDMTITNGANTIMISRSMYYYDSKNPYAQISVVHGGDGDLPLLNQKVQPTLVDTSGDLIDINVSLLVPNSLSAFDPSTNATISVNGDDVTGNVYGVTETTLTGTTPFKLINFTIPSYSIDPAVHVQTVALDVYFNSTGFTTRNPQPYFYYYPGENNILNMWLVNATGDMNSDDPKSPLDGAEVTKPDIYILVHGNPQLAMESGNTKTYTATDLHVAYVVGGSPLTVTYEGDYTNNNPPTPDDSNSYKVYKITGLNPGQQKLSFSLAGGPAVNATVSYVSKNYITVNNLVDGQTITYDSNVSTPDVLVDGEFIGSDPFISGSLSVNGNLFASYTSPPTPTFNFTFSETLINTTDLHPGKNTITLNGKFQTSSVTMNVSKDITIYMVDTNIPTVKRFEPTLIPSTGRTALPEMSLPTAETTLRQVFVSQPDIQFQNQHYMTGLKKLDLTFRVSGVSNVALKQGSTIILNIPIPAGAIASTSVAETSTEPAYDISGSYSDLVIRVKDLPFTATGTQAFTIELLNGAGATSSKKIEVERQVTGYRLISPVPNSGSRVVVNKNFIHIDIEAEGATEVLVDGKKATLRSDSLLDRYTYDYIGLKPDKETSIKVQVKRQGGVSNDTIKVFYTADVNIDSEFMEKLSSKHSVFNKGLELSFPKGTVLKRVISARFPTTKYYDGSSLLFGIADPADGVVGRINDYGNVLNKDLDARTKDGAYPIPISSYLSSVFSDPTDRANFARISQVYWTSAGYAEDDIYGPTGGLEPYTLTNTGDNAGPSLTYAEDPTVRLERTLLPSNRGTLTLKFDEHVVDAAAPTITVFHLTDQGRWINIGGEVNVKNHTITVPFDNFGYYMVGKLNNSFQDITSHRWAKNILEALYAKGFMNSAFPGLFGSDDQITRGEFVTLLVKALNLPLNYDDNATFVDVIPGSLAQTWDYEHIETAARAGIVDGLEGKYFGVIERLTREQAATMIGRALDLKLALNDAKLLTSVSKLYTDADKIYYYALPSVEAVSKAGIMQGKPDDLLPGQKKATAHFDPQAQLTRAEAGQIAVRLLQKSSKVFPTNLN